MKEIKYLKEDNYIEQMDNEVMPFLEKCREDDYFEGYDGSRIHYNTYHLENAKSCIVISHGFCEFAEKYSEFIYYLLQAGYSVYIPEHRGHGYSERKASDLEMVYVRDFQEYVDDFKCFLEKKVNPRESKKILYAHSMGGAIGALVLEQFGSEFDAAVLSSPMLCMKTGNYPSWLAEVISDAFCIIGRGESYAAGQHGFSPQADTFENSCSMSRARHEHILRKRIENPSYRTAGGSYAWLAAGQKAQRKLMKKENISKIKLPLLLFEAGNDDLVDNRAIEKFAELAGQTTDARLISIAGSKHEIVNADEEKRTEYYGYLFDFLEKF